ncbi:MAG: hypothetical protein S4CHLAM6_07350 [Chlamydiae bacterium]|nr:hypothetical protein [Chlamydiota bacterium]
MTGITHSLSLSSSIPSDVEKSCMICFNDFDGMSEVVVDRNKACHLQCVKTWFLGEGASSTRCVMCSTEMTERDFEVIGCPDQLKEIHSGNTEALISELEEELEDIRSRKRDAVQILKEVKDQLLFGGIFYNLKHYEMRIKKLTDEEKRLDKTITRMKKYTGTSTKSLLKATAYSAATTACSIFGLYTLSCFGFFEPKDESQEPNLVDAVAGIISLAATTGAFGGLVNLYEPACEILTRSKYTNCT